MRVSAGPSTWASALVLHIPCHAFLTPHPSVTHQSLAQHDPKKRDGRRANDAIPAAEKWANRQMHVGRTRRFNISHFRFEPGLSSKIIAPSSVRVENARPAD